jgi:aspartate kinase
MVVRLEEFCSRRVKGIDAELVVLDSIVDAAMTAATDSNLASSGDQGVAQLGQEFYDQLAVRLGERLRECGTRVPVITGEATEESIRLSLTLT